MNDTTSRFSKSFARLATSVSLVLAVSGCALLGKGEVLSPRYFSPEAPPTAVSAAPEGATAQSTYDKLQLRLGRVSAAPYLGERIVFRESEYELGFYEERRWTEKPGAYLQRALSQSLFQTHEVRRIVAGPGPTLEVELTELAELRQTPPMARVRATYILYDHRLVLSEATLTVEVPVATADSKERGNAFRDAPEVAEVQAMSLALNDLVERIVERVLAELQAAKARSDEAARVLEQPSGPELR